MKSYLLSTSLLISIGALQAQTIVGFSFSNSNLIPETVDQHLAIQNQAGFESNVPVTVDLSTTPGTAYFKLTSNALIGGSDMGLVFDVVIDPGYELNLTGLFVGQENMRYSDNGNGIAALYYDTGSGFVEVPAGTSTQHIPTDDSAGAGDYSNNTITLSGLTGTVTIAYYATSYKTNQSDRLKIDDLNLSGTVSQIPEPSVFATFAGLSGLILIIRRRCSLRQ